MKQHYVDFRFEYKGYGIHDSWCIVQVYTHKGKCVVVMTEPGVPDTGTSVTNACETIATKLFNQEDVFPKGTKPENILWFETYAKTYEDMETGSDAVDQIDLDYVDGEFRAPTWTRVYTDLETDKIFFLERAAELIENSDV